MHHLWLVEIDEALLVQVGWSKRWLGEGLWCFNSASANGIIRFSTCPCFICLTVLECTWMTWQGRALNAIVHCFKKYFQLVLHTRSQMWCTQGAIMEILISVAVLKLFFTLEVIQQHSSELKHADRRSLHSSFSAEAHRHRCCKVKRLFFTLNYVSHSAPGDFFFLLCIKRQLQTESIKLHLTGLASAFYFYSLSFICLCTKMWMWWQLHSVQKWKRKNNKTVQPLLYNADKT